MQAGSGGLLLCLYLIQFLLIVSWILVVKELRFDHMIFNRLQWKLRINVIFGLWSVTTLIWCVVLCFLTYQWRRNVIFSHIFSIVWKYLQTCFSSFALGGHSIASAASSEPIHKQSQPYWKIYTNYLCWQSWILVYGLCVLRQCC